MAMDEDVKTLKDYLQMAIRRKYTIAIPMLLMIAASVIVALALPPIYRSEATIMIEKPHISADIVKSTVEILADERIRQIEKIVMAQDNIKKIINKFDLYTDNMGNLQGSELIEYFRENASLELVESGKVVGGNPRLNPTQTLAFTLAFSHKSAELAQKVVDELVTFFLSENIRRRTQRAEGTTKFLGEESQKLKLEIQKIEKQIADYKEKYSDSLPELLAANLSSIGRIENEIQQLSAQEKTLYEKQASLRSQLALTSPNLAPTVTDNETPTTLPELNAELNRLASKYSENHPNVKAIKRKIANYKPLVNQAGEVAINNPAYLQAKGELDIAILELRSLNSRRSRLQEKLSSLEARISKTPQVERGYDDLQRDLDNNKEKYKELQTKYLTAKLAQTLEEEQKAEKFSLLEPPIIPTIPDKPDRLKIFFLGLVISVGGGFGIGFLAEIMDGSIRGYRSLENVTGIEPLVVIPYIQNELDKQKIRKNLISFSIFGIIMLIAMIAAIHFLYMPLDLLWYKVLDKLNTL